VVVPTEATTQTEVTRILHAVQDGQGSAVETLLPLVYEELRHLAGRFLQRERHDHTLQPTALVHEAYLKLVNQDRVQWQGRAHFYAVAAQAMRRILINHAEAHRARKRGGDLERITLTEGDTPAPDSHFSSPVDLLALNDALTRLEVLDQRQCRVVELRFFGGLSVDETAHVLGVSPRLVKLDWQMARTWLYQQLETGGGA
jgi:RNA polymerase sigma-70 factor, ECF subfamily